MAKNNELTSSDTDYLIKLCSSQALRLEKMAKKSDEQGDKRIATAARAQKAEVDALIQKLL